MRRLSVRKRRKVMRHLDQAVPAALSKTGIHVKTLHPMFGPKCNPTSANQFDVIACLLEQEGVRLRVVA